MEYTEMTPVVMTFSDHDPSGASGIQADVETMFSMGCHCSSIATALTAQDTVEYKDSVSTSPTMLIEQARSILEDMLVSVFKIGHVSSVENIQAIDSIVRDYPQTRVVLQPSITSLYGLASDHVIEGIRNLLLPVADVVAINIHEAPYLAPQADTLNACVHAILDTGVHYLLVSGMGTDATQVTNQLYTDRGIARAWQWPRLPHTYLGSDSTLTASIAGHLAHGFDTVDAVDKAQHYTWNAMKNGRRIGMGQHIPDRMYWNR